MRGLTKPFIHPAILPIILMLWPGMAFATQMIDGNQSEMIPWTALAQIAIAITESMIIRRLVKAPYWRVALWVLVANLVVYVLPLVMFKAELLFTLIAEVKFVFSYPTCTVGAFDYQSMLSGIKEALFMWVFVSVLLSIVKAFIMTMMITGEKRWEPVLLAFACMSAHLIFFVLLLIGCLIRLFCTGPFPIQVIPS